MFELGGLKKRKTDNNIGKSYIPQAKGPVIVEDEEPEDFEESNFESNSEKQSAKKGILIMESSQESD